MSLELPQHSAHPFFDVADDDMLLVDGRRLADIVATAGQTPLYLYSRRYMSERVAALRAALPREVHLHYAMKANPLPEVVRHFVPLVDGIDVASGRELDVALAAGAAPATISFAGPGKSVLELRQAARAGIVINVESETELARLAAIGAETGTRPRVAIRVNPAFELKTSGMKMGGGPKQFGIDSERVPEVLASLASDRLEFVGFHIFSGSQNLRAEAIVEAQQKAVQLASELARSASSPVRILNVGGGLGIPYFPGERPLEVAPIAANLAELVERTRTLLPQAQLVIELGRYLVGEAGLYVCRVTDRKISRGQVFLVTDGGMHHHLSASGNFGQVLRKNYPVVVGNRVRGVAREKASVVGPLCTPLDLLADRADMARADIGDLIVVLQSGAYGRTASPLGFLSHPEPAEIVI